MKKHLIFIIIFGIICGYISFLKMEKKKKIKIVATHFKELCLRNNKCIVKPSDYDKNSKYPIYYEVKNNQKGFELTWRIMTGVTIIARYSLNQEIVITESVD